MVAVHVGQLFEARTELGEAVKVQVAVVGTCRTSSMFRVPLRRSVIQVVQSGCVGCGGFGGCGGAQGSIKISRVIRRRSGCGGAQGFVKIFKVTQVKGEEAVVEVPEASDESEAMELPSPS